MPDPRERIETKHLRCNGMTPTQWVVAAVGQHAPAFADWPEVVEFAAAIIAADAEWRESNTPTLEEMRARYPGAMVEITPLHIPGDDYLVRLVTESVSVEHATPTVGHALEWLAAKLAEGGDDGSVTVAPARSGCRASLTSRRHAERARS